MYKRIGSFISFCIFAALPIVPAQAQTSATSQLPQLVQQEEHTYPQQKLADCDANAARTQSLGSAQMKIDPQGKVIVQGYDHQGRPWTASLETSPVAKCEVWQAALNGDGQNDLVLINFGTNSSGGWDTSLSLLIFDASGRPFPWQATGNFHVGAAGITEIVSTTVTSTPNVIVAQREGDRFSGYTFRDNTLAVVSGRLSSIENKSRPALLAEGQALTAKQPATPQQLDALTTVEKQPGDDVWPRVLSLTGNTDDTIALHMSDGKVFSEPIICILDLRSGERLIHFSSNEADLERLYHDGASVISVGTSCEQEACQPLILWAKF